MAASSGITLTSGIRANLYSLQNTNTLLERTQKRLATGQRVQTAVDDPVNYFTALGHRQRAQDLASRKDEMSESVQLISAANEGVESITALIASAKSLAQSALSASTEEEITTLQSQFNEVRNQIDSLATDSGYKGVNLLKLDGNAPTQHEVKFDENGDSTLTMTGFDATTEGLAIDEISADNSNTWWAEGTPDTVVEAHLTFDGATLYLADDGTSISTDAADAENGYFTGTVYLDENGDPTAAADDGAGTDYAEATAADGLVSVPEETVPGTAGGVDKSNIKDAIIQLDEARTTLRSEAQKLSTNLSIITIRQDFTKGMINTLEDGAAELTNADMNEEGANMLMLQTRQSLGTTSLSLASQAAQSVMRLF